MKLDEELIFKILDITKNCKSISEIAQQLYLSQPYISQVLKHAEDFYKVKLINRQRIPIYLTPAGEQVKNGLSKIISERNKVKTNLRPFIESEENTIRISYTPIWSKQQGSIFKELQKRYPNTKFLLCNVFTSNTSYNLIVNHTSDIFWGRYLKGKEITSTFLYRQIAYLLIPKNSPLFEKGKREIAFSNEKFNQLNGANLVSLENDSWFQQAVNHVFLDNGIKTIQSVIMNDFIGAAELAIQGLGINVTLANTLDYISTKEEFNYMKLPLSMLNLDTGLSISNEAPKKVQQIANSLAEIIDDVGWKA